MTVESASRHILTDEEANCATSSLYALLPHRPSDDTIFAAIYNGGSMTHLQSLVHHEFYRRGCITKTAHLRDDQRPSQFLASLERELVEHPEWRFAGVMLLTKDQEPEHVVTVVRLHDDRSATIVDTAPSIVNLRQRKPWIRRVPFRALDRRVRPPDDFYEEPRMIAFFYQAAEAMVADNDRLQKLWEELQAAAQCSVDVTMARASELQQELDAEEKDAWQLFGGTKREARVARRMWYAEDGD